MDSGFNYIQWVIIIVVVNFGFNFYKAKNYSNGKIFLFTILPAWMLVGLIKYFFNNDIQDSILGSIIETLPMTILFGGGTFIYKFYNSKKR